MKTATFGAKWWGRPGVMATTLTSRAVADLPRATPSKTSTLFKFDKN